MFVLAFLSPVSMCWGMPFRRPVFFVYPRPYVTQNGTLSLFLSPFFGLSWALCCCWCVVKCFRSVFVMKIFADLFWSLNMRRCFFSSNGVRVYRMYSHVFLSFFVLFPIIFVHQFTFMQLYACKSKIELVRCKCELINESVALGNNQIGMETIIVLVHKMRW